MSAELLFTEAEWNTSVPQVVAAQGTLRYADLFPDYWARHHARVPPSVQTCADVFDAFILNRKAQVARNDLTAGDGGRRPAHLESPLAAGTREPAHASLSTA